MEPTASPKPYEDREMDRRCTPEFYIGPDGALPHGFLDFLRLTPWVSAVTQRHFYITMQNDTKLKPTKKNPVPNSFSRQHRHRRPDSNLDSITRVFKGPLPEKTRRSQNDSVGYSFLPISSLARTHRWANFFMHDKETSRYLALRNIRHFLAWLAINYSATYPTDQSHLTNFLQVRLSEPCNRGSLKLAYESFVFSTLSHEFPHSPGSRLRSCQACQTGSSNVHSDAQRTYTVDFVQQCTTIFPYLRMVGTRTNLGHATIRRSPVYQSEKYQSRLIHEQDYRR